MKIAKKIDSTRTALTHAQDSKSAAMFMSRNARASTFVRGFHAQWNYFEPP